MHGGKMPRMQMTTPQEQTLYGAREDAVRAARRKPGQELPNGAMILADVFVRHDSPYGERHLVLAMNSGAFQPFVTWWRCIGVQQQANGTYGPLDYCFEGHYFKDLGDALSNFESRREKASS